MLRFFTLLWFYNRQFLKPQSVMTLISLITATLLRLEGIAQMVRLAEHIFTANLGVLGALLRRCSKAIYQGKFGEQTIISGIPSQYQTMEILLLRFPIKLMMFTSIGIPVERGEHQ